MSAIGSTEVKNPGAAKIEGKVEFKVAKSWIATDNIDEATVKLNRYDGSGGNRNALTTSKVGENDATVFFFEAETPGFSMFAVTGEKKVEVEAAAVTPTPTPAVVAPTPAAPATTPSPTAPPASEVPGFGAIFAAVSLLIVYTMVYRNKIEGKEVVKKDENPKY